MKTTSLSQISAAGVFDKYYSEEWCEFLFTDVRKSTAVLVNLLCVQWLLQLIMAVIHHREIYIENSILIFFFLHEIILYSEIFRSIYLKRKWIKKLYLKKYIHTPKMQYVISALCSYRRLSFFLFPQTS